MIYKLYLNTPNGYKKQGECDYDTIMFILDNMDEDNYVIIIEYYEELNMDDIFYSGRVGDFNKKKGKVRKL